MDDDTRATANILLVDDEPNILSALRRVLRPTGFTIHTAESGIAGLEILEQNQINLVISDMRMPNMDGAKFLEHVRQRWPNTIRILLTGYSDVSSTIDAINRGEIYRYISKPWQEEDLLLIVRDALEKQHLVAENQRLLSITQSQNAELKDLNASLENKVRQRTSEIEQVNSFLNLANEQLKQNFLISIKVFSGLIELRGGIMAGHSRRVADLARKLCTHLNIPTGERQDIYYAALLHDIGKIGFPDALVSKPVSRMSTTELNQYKTHVLTGESALMPLEELKQAARIIRSHHERFDGQGFPDGISGTQICFGARIISLVDHYDALQCGTQAETKFTPIEAREAILRSRGRRYDPIIVDAFLDLLDNTANEDLREHRVAHTELEPGMVLSRDLVSKEGTLLLSVDHVLDASLIRQIQTYCHRHNHSLELFVRTNPTSGEEKQ